MTLIRILTERRAALKRWIRRLLLNPDHAADVSREVFLRVYAAELRHATPVSDASLSAMTRNRALGARRQRTARVTDAGEDTSGLAAEAPGANPDGIVTDRKIVQAVERAMTRMPPLCLEVFRLRRIGDLSHAEIAARLEISTKTVERHITQALKLGHEALLESRAVQPQQRRFDDREAA